MTTFPLPLFGFSTARIARLRVAAVRTAAMRTAAVRAAAVLAAVLVAGGALAQDAAVPSDADAIVDRIVENLRGGGQRATIRMTVERDDATDRYVLETIGDGDERALTRVVAPPNEAGRAFLVDGSELFVYAPRVGRSLRLPPSGRSDGFLGSDLSYDDLAGDELRDTYDAAIAERTDDRVVVSLVPRAGAATPYGELRLTARLPDLTPLELTYLDQRDAPVKRLTLHDPRTLEDGRTVPTRFEVVDLTEGGGRTIATWEDATFGVEPPDRCFTLEALETGCRW